MDPKNFFFKNCFFGFLWSIPSREIHIGVNSGPKQRDFYVFQKLTPCSGAYSCFEFMNSVEPYGESAKANQNLKCGPGIFYIVISFGPGD